MTIPYGTVPPTDINTLVPTETESKEVTKEGVNLDAAFSSNSNIQLVFAKLQMQMATANKQKAEKSMDELSTSQKAVKLCADVITKAKAEAAKVSNNLLATTPLTEEVSKYFKDHLLTIPTKDKKDLTFAEWETVIAALNKQQEDIGVDTQQQMVYINDFLAQYNSYLGGVNSCIAQASNALSQIARNL
ncbi:MAG: hypothetical protein LBE31_01810 [Deltaproteobacteria bacterium]|jgi:hypothetical protein|nr:hypothetical protein [Deltaproteobacteria bacterium]